MPVPQPPSIDTNIIDDAPVSHVRSDEVFFVTGTYAADPTTVGLDGPFFNAHDAISVAGADSMVAKAVSDIFSGNLDATVYTSGVVGVSGTSVGTPTNILAAHAVVRGVPQGRRPLP